MARHLTGRRALAGYSFLVPNCLGFLTFIFVPVLVSLVLSFTDWEMLMDRPAKFIGLGNFIELLGLSKTADGWQANDPFFWQYMYNTAFLMLSIPISMAASLLLAIVLNNKLRGIVAFRTAFFFPTICTGVALFMVWRLMYNYDYGMINRVLGWMNVQGPDWLNSTIWAKPAIMFMMVWIEAGGYNMIIYLAGLQGIPPQLYEAADIDGAGKWSQFRHITWPMLAPTTFFIFTMATIRGFQGGFEAAYIMTKGGPAGSTTTISYYIYNMAYTGDFRLGYGAAIAWVLFIIVFTVTMINWRYGGRGVTGDMVQ